MSQQSRTVAVSGRDVVKQPGLGRHLVAALDGVSLEIGVVN